jgi:hypothetical protein
MLALLFAMTMVGGTPPHPTRLGSVATRLMRSGQLQKLLRNRTIELLASRPFGGALQYNRPLWTQMQSDT